MTPAPGDRLQRFVGDRIAFGLKDRDGHGAQPGWRAVLRTNLGRAALLRREILQAHTRGLPPAGASWRDIAMKEQKGGWVLELPLAEVGFFRAKAYLVDPRGWQHWPPGPDVGVAVHPNGYRTANTIYCAFPRMFGQTRTALSTLDPKVESRLAELDQAGYTVIPPSGKLRNLISFLPHIMGTLGCRILHLLPVNPTPTTYARFGRFGSPYAALDLTAIDPALVIFDRRTTGLDQFRELTYAAHLRGGRVLLDIAINHTGWSSVLQENHPEWFLRGQDGEFASPGAWGVTWEDLVELKHGHVALWDELAEMFLTWCRRGVDGFRCDAGYKAPVAAWQYIVARVQQEYPETLFLLEGLGGAWESTEALLTEGGLQWAYSELFQNYSGLQVAGYLDHSFRHSERVGLLVHYSETHDNERLAARGRAWSLLRNRLCALASVSGGFGFTCGVEWLATEKILVHGSTGMAWDNPDNLLPELARLNSLLAEHPCFFDGASLARLSPADSPVYALRRQSAEGQDVVLVLVNTDVEGAHTLALRQDIAALAPVAGPASEQNPPNPNPNLNLNPNPNPNPNRLAISPVVAGSKAEGRGLRAEHRAAPPAPDESALPLAGWVDLLGQEVPTMKPGPDGGVVLTLGPGAAYCLAPDPLPRGLRGEDYRRARARAAWGLSALNEVLPLEAMGELDWRALAAAVDRSPEQFLALISHLSDVGAQAAELRDAILSLSAQGQPAGAPASAGFPRAHAILTVSAQAQPGTVPAAVARTDDTVYPRVVTWQLEDSRRITPVPPAHWLLIRDAVPLRAVLDCQDGSPPRNVESIPVGGGYIACLPPRQDGVDAHLLLERYAPSEQHVAAAIRFLAPRPDVSALSPRIADPLTRASSPASAKPSGASESLRPTELVLLTNGRGAMARLCLDLGRVNSKYDCALGANLHPSLPVDRHIFAKRIRVWVNADGFISPLDFRSLASFASGPPAVWHFVANAGDGRTVEIQMTADMLEERNTTVFHLSRPTAAQATGKQLPAEADVVLTVRVDIEDRNFHSETKRNGGTEYHFASNLHPLPEPAPALPKPPLPAAPNPLQPQVGIVGPVPSPGGSPQAAPNQLRPPDPAPAPDIGYRQLPIAYPVQPPEPALAPKRKVGFAFTPAPDRQLRVFADAGCYHPQPEWSQDIPHPVEQSRGQVGSGDALSPGWFELPLPKGGKVTLVLTADPADPDREELEGSRSRVRAPRAREPFSADDVFGQQLVRAARAFVVRRGQGRTVIAGYPWFLDWGRDTLICARGLLAAGLADEVTQLVLTFARFEKEGTLPNTIFGEDASNRDTSDAPLWFGIVCEEIAALSGSGFYKTKVGPGDATIADVLWDIALSYAKGTPNGIRMDRGSALIWSPKHFTWMDTNYPACTPREGYPVEIQALWIRLLRQVERVGNRAERQSWDALAAQALESVDKFFWREGLGYYADLLAARPGQPAAGAVVDDTLRSNGLFMVSLGLARGGRAKRCVEAARRRLVVPGALRSLAPLPVSVPLPIYGNDGRLLNNPAEPYWGRYEGDEDTRRKPAYHNGTAWTWTFPAFCEALARAWDFSPPAVAAARAYLGSMARLMAQGCLGQLPELLDGDAPHTPRGCDAQAWGATEALRVWKLLGDAKQPKEILFPQNAKNPTMPPWDNANP
jgi:predicted glycogen debranching enzyme